MSKSPATREFARRERPLSPHLTVYRPPITMTMSIIHRITGGALYFGTLLVALWLMAAASSQATFDWVNWAFGTWLGRLILFGYTWALMHHMLGGVRHLVWDTGAGLVWQLLGWLVMGSWLPPCGVNLDPQVEMRHCRVRLRLRTAGF